MVDRLYEVKAYVVVRAPGPREAEQEVEAALMMLDVEGDAVRVFVDDDDGEEDFGDVESAA